MCGFVVGDRMSGAAITSDLPCSILPAFVQFVVIYVADYNIANFYLPFHTIFNHNAIFH